MLPNIRKMSPSDLSALRQLSKKHVSVQWRVNEADQYETILENFPLSVAWAQSELVRQQFPGRTFSTTTTSTFIDVTGGIKKYIKAAFQFMLMYCDGFGYRPYRPSSEDAFVAALRGRDATELLGMTILTQDLDSYIAARLEGALSDTDVMMLFEGT